MALGESLVRTAARTPQRYAAKVRWLAVVYVAINLVAAVVIAIVLWRIRYLVTITQRSNVETLVLAIVVVLAMYYIASTARGFIGAVRIAWLSVPKLWNHDPKAVERRKHRALTDGGTTMSVCFDRVVRAAGDDAITWPIADAAGRLGALTIEGAAAIWHPIKAGVNNSLFEFLAEQVNAVLCRRDPELRLEIVFWGNVDSEAAAVYRGAVTAFDTLAERLGGGPVWPSLQLSREEIDAIGDSLLELVPALRNEALLPDLEYEIEYSVPILPEPLAFVQLKRREPRADPVLSMSYSLLVQMFILGLLLLLLAYPPWLPSR